MFLKMHIIILISLLGCARGLRMLQLRVPAHVLAGTSARLECLFDLEGEELYSTNWYKDGHEFYRYKPSSDAISLAFPLAGLHVDVENSSSTHILLVDVPLTASGEYRCEVSAEAPNFQTVADYADMTVVYVPDTSPKISGGKSRYHLGETAQVNCTAPATHPPAHVSWFINGEPADPAEVSAPLHSPDGSLVATSVQLKFKVRARHFMKGDMKLKCLMSVGSVYSRSNEESVEGDRLLKGPALESRNALPEDTAAATHLGAGTHAGSHAGTHAGSHPGTHASEHSGATADRVQASVLSSGAMHSGSRTGLVYVFSLISQIWLGSR